VELLSTQDYPNISSSVKNLFMIKEIPQNLPVAGRLRHFLRNWECLTQDPQILKLVMGYRIPFLSLPAQTPYFPIKFSPEERSIIDEEVTQMIQKGAIKEVSPSEDQLLSPIFVVPKKDSGFRPVINLKHLNSHVEYLHFKMEGLHLLKDLLKPGDVMCKLDLKDAYFSVPLQESSQQFVRFQWGHKIYQFLCLCFGLGPAPRIFTKLMKIPIAILRRLNMRLIIFLDDILLMATTEKELFQGRDTLIFLLQSLGFLINIKKSQLNPTQKIQFLGVNIDSIKMEVSLPQEKLEKIHSQCQDILERKSLSLRELASIVQWKDTDRILPANVNSNRCLDTGVGGILSWSENWRSLVTSREKVPYKLSRTKSDPNCSPNIHKIISRSEGHSYSDRQHGSTDIFSQNGGYKKSGIDSVESRNLGIPLASEDHDYCRTPTRETKCGSRSSVKIGKGLKRVEIEPISIQKTMHTEGDSECGSICLENISSGPQVHVLETRPLQYRQRCFPGRLETSGGVCVPAILSYTTSIEKDQGGRSNFTVDNSSLANSSLVSTGPANEHPKSHINSKGKKPSTRSMSGITSSKPQSTTGGMESIRKNLASKGVSERAVSLISRPGESLVAGVVSERVIPFDVL